MTLGKGAFSSHGVKRDDAHIQTKKSLTFYKDIYLMAGSLTLIKGWFIPDIRPYDKLEPSFPGI